MRNLLDPGVFEEALIAFLSETDEAHVRRLAETGDLLAVAGWPLLNGLEALGIGLRAIGRAVSV